MKQNHPRLLDAVDTLGKTVREEGPLDAKTGLLVQVAGAAAIRSEGSVHSHVRRALEAGIAPDEIFHAVILLTNTIGFPQVSAAVRWANDIVQAQK